MRLAKLLVAAFLFQGCIVDGTDLPVRLWFSVNAGEIPPAEPNTEFTVPGYVNLDELALYLRVNITTTGDGGMFYAEYSVESSLGFNPDAGADFYVDMPSGSQADLTAVAFANNAGTVQTFETASPFPIRMNGDVVDIELVVEEQAVGSIMGTVIPPQGVSLSGASLALVDCDTNVVFPSVEVLSGQAGTEGMFMYENVVLGRAFFFVLILPDGASYVRRDKAIELPTDGEGKTAVFTVDFSSGEDPSLGCFLANSGI